MCFEFPIPPAPQPLNLKICCPINLFPLAGSEVYYFLAFTHNQKDSYLDFVHLSRITDGVNQAFEKSG